MVFILFAFLCVCLWREQRDRRALMNAILSTTLPVATTLTASQQTGGQDG
jgi:hypothetical protein